MKCLLVGVVLIYGLALTGCSTGFSKSSAGAVRRIAVEEPENPTGIVPVPDMSAASGSGAVYVPPGGGLIGAAVAGLAKGIVEGAMKEKSAPENAPPPNGLTFLADYNFKIGTLIAENMRSALTAEGYLVVPASAIDDADAVVSFKIIELGYMYGFDGMWHPNLQVRVTLRNARTKSTLFQETYHYTGFVHSMWDEAIDADPQYAATAKDMFGDNDKLLFESLRSGVEKIAGRASGAMRPSQPAQ